MTAFSLAGCTPEDDIYLTKHDAAVTFVTCESVTATRIAVQRMPTRERDVTLWEDVWVLTGEATLPYGNELHYGSPPEGLEQELFAAPITDSAWDLKLIIDGVDQRGTEVRIVGEWEFARFDDGGWHASARGNALVDKPCG